MPRYFCVFDVGTTGVKAGILSSEGRLIASTYREYGALYNGPQWVEQLVEGMWQAQCEASRELLANARIAPSQIACVSVSSQRATFAPVDRDCTPLTNFIGWQDKRSLDQCRWIEEKVGSEAYYRIAGLPIEPTAAVSKILWLRDNAPELFERTHRFASTQTIHLHQLGVHDPPCDLPDAAYLGLLDVDHLRWSGELLARLDLAADKMPELVPSGTLAGKVSSQAALATGLSAGTPIAVAGGDLQCAGLGMGVAAPGIVSVGIGTGGGVLFHLDRPLRHPGRALNCLPHAVQGAWEMEGICLASGAAYRWLRDTLGEIEKEAAAGLNVDPYDLLNAQAAQVPAGANGLMVMPALMGAGAPNWYSSARGVILGLTLATSKKALVRAMLEGICLEIRWILEAAEELGTRVDEVRIWGGAAKSKIWNQIAADVYGVPAARTEISEAGLVGAAICGGIAIGEYRDAREGVQAMVRTAERYDPRPSVRARYDEMFSLYKDTFNALRSHKVFERLAALGLENPVA